MRPAIENAQGAVIRAAKYTVSPSTTLRQRSTFVCLQCRHRTLFTSNGFKRRNLAWQDARRGFSWTARRQQDELKRTDGGATTTTTKEERAPLNGITDEQLPSQRERIRWRASKYMNQLMDDLMPKLALASQRINTYTGTDYTGIETLRKKIIEQEQLVKTHHATVLSAKESLETARVSESQSRKEVVSLLERRHSWTDTDLERYMSLIRSEHLNDQAVQTAKDVVTSAEKALEEARGRLERMERMQYHEEQIWSDTIRRNSTWVTFGLMGVNILLLLVTMGIVEPWRRKRMVGEIKRALEENKVPVPAIAALEPVIEKDVDLIVEPEGMPAEALEATEPTSTTIMIPPDAIPPEPRLPTIIPDESTPNAQDPGDSNTLKNKVADLFSEQKVTVRKVDISTIALEGAAAGAAFVVIIMALLRPR